MTTKNLEWNGAPLEVTAGRVAVIDLGAAARAVVDRPDSGNVSINPDGTLALVLNDPDATGPESFSVEIDGPDGPRVVEVRLDVEKGSQSGGWGQGDHYAFRTDADGASIIETGENHRKVYVSGSNDALSLADVAAREGVSVRQIDGDWLAAHPEYGGSEEMALDFEAGTTLWKVITAREAAPSSHWLLLERGYEYEGRGRLISKQAEGESPLHPIVIGAWGEGEKPVLVDELRAWNGASENFVVRDIALAHGAGVLDGKNFLFENLDVTGDTLSLQGVEGLTVRRTEIVDVIRDEPVKGGWSPHSDRIQGIYVANSDHVLIEENLIDHSGWAEGYGSPKGKIQVPSMMSHNVYIQSNATDITFRDNVSTRGSSFAAQIRPGGFVEGNVFADSNAALLVGDGNYSLVLDNVVTSAAHKLTDFFEGAITIGITNQGKDNSLVGNIVAHSIDPDSAAEKAFKTINHPGLKLKEDPLHDDTIVYNWHPVVVHPWQTDNDQNVPDIPLSKLDDVTLRHFAEDVLGVNAGTDAVDTVVEWLRAEWGDTATAADIIDFFREGFGIADPDRGMATTLRFVPSDLGEGFRWDNHLNWTGDGIVPGNGDQVELGGNWVTYSGTTSLEALDLGAGGILTVRQGWLDVGRLSTGEGGRIEVGYVGQFWTDGYRGEETLDIDIDGGRFGNTGRFDGPADIGISGGQLLLATDRAEFRLDGSLSIEGTDARVGFDGTGGVARLTLADGARLGFTADAGGFATIGEFRSGYWDHEAPGVRSIVDLGDGTATLALDFSGFGAGTSWTLIQADKLSGGFGAVEMTGGGENMTIVLNYETGTLRLEAAGTSGAQTAALPSLALSDGTASLEIDGRRGKDVFHVATGVDTLIRDYQVRDRIDVSAVLEAAGITAAEARGNLRIETVSAGQSDLVLERGGSELHLARLGHDVRVDAVAVELGQGLAETVSRSAAADNADPVAAVGRFEGSADGVLFGRAEARDADGDALTFELVSQPQRGKVTMDADGSFSFDPAAAFDALAPGKTAKATFTYAVSDGNGGIDTARIMLKLRGAADEATADEATANEVTANEVTGTPGWDILTGAAGVDVIRGGSGGIDQMWGRGGADAFVFGAQAGNGQRNHDQIHDYQPGVDTIVLEAGARVADVQDTPVGVWLTLEGDGDLIAVAGPAGLVADDLTIVDTDGIWIA